MTKFAASQQAYRYPCTVKNTVAPSSSLPTLLLVTDFSDISYKALQWAIPEAQHHHWKISVLYPYRLDQAGKREYAVKSKKDMEREAVLNFKQRLEEVLTANSVLYEFHAEVGFIHDRVTEHARKANVVLMVIGQALAKESLLELLEELKIPTVIIPSSE